MRKFILILTFLPTIIFAKTYKEIRFENLVRLSELFATELIGFGAGDDVSDEQINKAILELFHQEYFLDIAVDEPEDGVLRFVFKEKPSISKIEFKGVSESERDEKYKPVFGIKKGDFYDARKIEIARKRLIDLVRMQGHYDSLVIIEPEIKDEKATLIITINKGKNIKIAQNNFHGLNAFDKKLAQKTLANKEAQSFGWFFGRSSGKLKLLDLPYDNERLKEHYLQKGYLDAEVSPAFLTADFDNYHAKIDYNITEGKPYSVNKISISVTDKENNLTDMIEDLSLKPMRVFNIDKMRKDLDKIREKVADEGYAFVKVFPDLKKDPENQLADIEYVVTYGKKVFINDVIISGNSRTLDRIIRREVFLAVSDQYSLSEIRESKAALMRLGYFEDVQIDEKRVSDELLDLVISVKETSTGSLMIGGGYSSYDGFILNASVSDRNLFGSGYGYAFELDTSKRTRRYEVSLTNPRVRDSVYSLSTSIYDTHYEATTYVRDSQGVGATVGRRFGRYWRGSVNVSTSRNENYYDDPDDFYVNGKTEKLALTPAASFNNTDDYFNPRRGSIFSQSVEFAGFGKDEEYTASTTSFSWFYGFEDLIEYDLIFRFKSRFQYIDGDMDDIKKFPIASRLFLGGTRSVRGYQSGTISPVNRINGEVQYDRYGDTRYTGGKIAYNQSLEFSIPLIEDAKMRLAFFYDFGTIGTTDITEEHRQSAGVALEWISPMGPLQFILASPLDKKDYDYTSSFEFTLGQRF